jgi:hypothetical protein
VPRVVEFVQIVNPKKPDEFLVLAKDDFDPAVHTLFVPIVTRTASEASVVGDTVQIDLTEQRAVPFDVTPPAPIKPTRTRKSKAPSTPEAL